MPGPLAEDLERAPHFLGGHGAEMQPKAMSVFFGGKSMLENAGQILRRDADAGVADREANEIRAVPGCAQNQALLRIGVSLGHGVLGVAQQIQQYLQDFMFVHADPRCFLVFANHLNVMAI